MLAAIALAGILQDPGFMPITHALVISEVSAPGRRPIPDDAIVDQLVRDGSVVPVEGTRLDYHGHQRIWRKLEAKKDGWFEDDALDNGYVAIQIDESQATDLILNAQGDSLVYVNGVPRAGDPYSYGYLNLPVHLNQGANELIFVCGRGRLLVRTKAVGKPIALQKDDATLPDFLTTETVPAFASLVTLNATAAFSKGLKVRATSAPGVSVTTKADSIPPYSARKLVFRIPPAKTSVPGTVQVTVDLLAMGKVIDTVTLPIQVKKPLDLQRRTFESQIDGSVQYYAVWPASKPSSKNALVLTLHGASVEAIGQAAAYTQKDWATIVAPTNRRPYGFDWEGVGRLDALEVLDIAKREFPHDPDRVDLTGHSMGGHGTWSIGTMYPGLFASIAPSAGWISFWSYGGGWNPSRTSPVLDLLRRSMNGGDTLGRVDNTLSEDVYILHGSADDNVPVEQARTMKKKLTEIHHPDLQYHEQPGAGHWWGNQCVDWPPIFKMIEGAKLNTNAAHVDFTTQNPDMASTDRWVTICQQREDLAPSHVVADRNPDGSIKVSTQNVAALKLTDIPSRAKVELDGQDVQPLRPGDSAYKWLDGKWKVVRLSSTEKTPERGSGFKQVFNHRFAFVVGTSGTPEENAWALSRAIYNAETMMYRGNGAVDIVLDREYSSGRFKNRNLILFGSMRTNSVAGDLFKNCPPPVCRPSGSESQGELLIYPKPGERDALVGAIFGSDILGMRLTDRLSLFGSGVDYPDWIKFGLSEPEHVAADGFFDNYWKLDPLQSAEAGKE